MTSQTWDSIFGGNPDQIFKGLYGSTLVKDYDPNFSLAAYTPFDSITGDFKSTILTTDGWQDIGYTDESGIEFAPTFTTADTNAWQARQALRTDCTGDSEAAMVTAIQSNPLIDALENNLPISSMGGIGQVGYQFTKSRVPVVQDRQVLFLGVDYTLGKPNYFARLYARSRMVKPDKKSLQAKTEVQAKLTFEAYPDALAGFAVRTFREGAGWRASGGTTGVPGTPVATVGGGTGLASITFTAPTTPNGPFTYNVFVNADVTPLPAGQVTVGGTLANPILSLTGLSSGATTFKVQAVGSNLSGSVQSAASNSITIT